MVGEQINPNGAEGVNPPPAEGVNPAQAGGGTPQVTEPNAATPESGYTPEQIAELRKQAALYEEAQKEITRRQQESAELRRQVDMREQALASLVGQQRAAVDPLVQAESEYAAARERFDTQAEIQALRKMRQLESQTIIQRAQQAAIDAASVRDGLREAETFGVSDPRELAEVSRSLTPKDLAIIAAARKGKLSEILNRQQQDQEKRANDAARLDAILKAGGSIGGGKRVPGAISVSDDGVVEVPAATYFGVPPSVAKKKWPNARIVK